MKIALGQMEVRPGRPAENLNTMLEMTAQAQRAGAELVIFPEMALPGYLLGDSWEQRAFLEDCEECGRRLIAESGDITIMFGNVAVDWERHNNDGRPRKYNAFFTAQGGKLVQAPGAPYPFAIKTLLPSYREFDDPRYFYSARQLADDMRVAPEEMLRPIELMLGGRSLRVGCLICEDGWSENYSLSPGEILARKNVDLLVNISCSPYTLGKNGKRHRLFAAQAAKAAASMIYVNNVGIQNNGKTVYTFDGSSTVYGADGKLLFCETPYEERLSVVNLFEPPYVEAAPQPEEETESIYRALRYGIGKFMKSIGASKVVIGVSGGIDSAVTAALYADVLGADSVMLVNMPSVFNSATTKGLAKELAANLGCRYMVMPIQESVDFTVKQIESADVGNPANGQAEHLKVSSFVTENIQARDRSARVLAGIAASWGAVFTCNANKSESTVGYSTLYGDQSGFLAALADLWKHQVYNLARYLNENVYGREVIPQATIDIVPSAELSANQAVDEGKGDPIQYPYHDYLFRAFVESWERATPQEILEWYAEGVLDQKIGCESGLIKKLFPDAKSFIEDLERWWNLYTSMAVAKRIQAPPVLAVSRRAFGFDHREAQNGPYYTLKYRELKAHMLAQSQA